MKDKLRELAEMVREAYRAGFIAACKWPAPVSQDVDSSAYIKEFNAWSFSVREKHAAILDAKRIEADERAVPVNADDAFSTFRLAYYGRNKSLAPELESFRRAYAAITHPPVLVAQWDEVDVELACKAAAMYADGAVFPDAYGDDEAEATREFMRAALRAAWGRASVATHPHSPDAADSGRVTKDVLAIGVRARNIEITRQQRAGEANNEDHALRIGIAAALAAQGQGDGKIVAWLAEDDAALAARTSGRMGDINDGTRFVSFNELKQGDYRHVFPLHVGHVPAASPAGVPDGWNPTDAEVREWLSRSDLDDDGRLEHWRTVIDDARSMHLLAAAPSAPECGEVGV